MKRLEGDTRRKRMNMRSTRREKNWSGEKSGVDISLPKKRWRRDEVMRDAF